MHDSMKTLPYAQDIANCFADRIGKHGLDRPSFDDYVARTAKALKRLRAAATDNSLPILTLPKREDEMRVMRDAVHRYRGLGHVIVLGTGGSSLGGKTVTALADGGLGSAGHLAGKPLLWFIENVDPWGFDKVVETIDAKSAGLIIISKSGGTAETLSQALALLPHIEKAVGREKLQQRCTVITEPNDNPLRRLAQRYGLPIIDHDPKVGGRYSVLSPTGMLPTLIAGLDAAKVRAGAQEALDALLDSEPARSPAAIGAALNIALAETRGATQTVVMPYIDRLAPFGFWFRQLWAESLGKEGKGTTPIRAQGAVDQHSQLQLYLNGPADKLYTIIMGEARGQGPRYAKDQLGGDRALDWLAGRTLGDLLDVSQRATAETLARNGRPVRIIRVPTLDERSLGALMMHYMLETIIAADLLGIDPFDQPAVEEGKKLARQYLAEMG
jgi:glucose-6-phosphate isomerase